MKKILSVLCFFVLGMAGTVGATTIDPAGGWSGYFSWYDGIDEIYGVKEDSPDSTWDYGDVKWDISVDVDSTMEFVTTRDIDPAGDAFAFYVDGNEWAWDHIYSDGAGLFSGGKYDLFLSAGHHTFTFYLTALAFDEQGIVLASGGGFAEFSPVAPVPILAPVPEPTTLFLLGSGLLGVVCLRKRREDL